MLSTFIGYQSQYKINNLIVRVKKINEICPVQYMEATGCLDPLSDIHIFALHHVYLPRINRVLEEFFHQHNNNCLRTEHNLTPMQMFFVSPQTSDPMWIDWDTYGVDVEGPVPNEHPDNCVIVVPPQVHVSSDTLTRLPNPLFDDGNFGISIYLSVTDSCTVLQQHNEHHATYAPHTGYA